MSFEGLRLFLFLPFPYRLRITYVPLHFSNHFLLFAVFLSLRRCFCLYWCSEDSSAECQGGQLSLLFCSFFTSFLHLYWQAVSREETLKYRHCRGYIRYRKLERRLKYRQLQRRQRYRQLRRRQRYRQLERRLKYRQLERRQKYRQMER